jgi:membrane dipeptidase
LKNIIFLLVLIAVWCQSVVAKVDYKELHQKCLVVDTHTDVLLQVKRGADISKRLDFGHVDLPRLSEGGVDVEFFAAWPNPDAAQQTGMFDQVMHLIDLLDRILKNNPDKIILSRSPKEIMNAVHSHKIAACIGVEGGTAIENDLDKLRTFYQRGVRYLSLTWNDSPDWASSAKDEISNDFEGHRGLTAFGKKVVRTMNEMGMLVDVSHSGEKTFEDVIATTSKPIIASHSGVDGICPHYRNLSDNQLRALKKNRGIVCINFYPGYLQSGFDRKYQQIMDESKAYLDSMRQTFAGDYLSYRHFRRAYLIKKMDPFLPSVNKIVDHIDYIINLIGDDYVGLGSDFDGISITPKGISDVSDMPEITRVMVERGYSEERICKILGGNFMRVFKEVVGE